MRPNTRFKSFIVLPIKHRKKEPKQLPFLLQYVNAVSAIIFGLIAIPTSFYTCRLQEQSNILASNDSIQRAQIDTLTAIVDTLTTIAEELRNSNTQLLFLVRNNQEQLDFSKTSNKPNLVISTPVMKKIPDKKDGWTLNFKITNYGRRNAENYSYKIYLLYTFDKDAKAIAGKNGEIYLNSNSTLRPGETKEDYFDFTFSDPNWENFPYTISISTLRYKDPLTNTFIYDTVYYRNQTENTPIHGYTEIQADEYPYLRKFNYPW